MSSRILGFLARSVGQSRRLAAAVALCAFAVPGHAITVAYNWVPNAGQSGSGTLTISDPGIVDAANFSGISPSALINLTYTWANGTSIDLTSVANVVTSGWQACSGYLINAFTISAATPVQFQLANSAGQCIQNWPTPGNTYVQPGAASNNLQSNGVYSSEVNAGTWQLAPPTVVPVPAAVWLMGSALAVFAGVRRKV